MKLKNKETGEIKDYDDVVFMRDANNWHHKYNSLAELCKEWEDYKPKKYWFISPIDIDVVETEEMNGDEVDEFNKKIGNWFETKEEAKRVVEKLKAWKRLEDAGFKFKEWKHTPLMETVDGYKIHIEAYTDKIVTVMKDLDLLFGDK